MSGAGAGPSPSRRWARSTAFVLGTGAVSWAWSEVGFWARFRTDDSAPGWLITWLAYSLVVAVVLRVVRRFPLRGAAGVVLVGALYGWLVEGVVAATVYGPLPVSVVWTGVAWHGLLTVGVGWILLPRAVRRGGVRAVGWCALVGVVWGLWSVGWWASPPEEGQVLARPELASYAGFVAIVCVSAAVGYAVMHACAPRADDRPSRWTLVAVLAVLTVWWVLTIVVAIPWAPVMLALLVALVWASLRRLEMREAAAEPRASDAGGDDRAVLGWAPGIPWRSLPPLAALPAAALATYALMAPLAPVDPGSGALYVGFVAMFGVLTVAGTVALVWSLWRAWGRRRQVREAVLAGAGELTRRHSARVQGRARRSAT
jgi:hypothetical protein